MRFFESIVCFKGVKKFFLKAFLINLFSLFFFNTAYTQSLTGVSEITFWLDASQNVAIDVDSSVLYWPNVINLSDSAYQTDMLKQPTWVAQDPLINNQPVIYFNGTSDQLYNTNHHNFGAMYVIARWSGSDTLFPDFNGIIAKYSTADFPYIFIGRAGESILFNNGTPWGATGTYINRQVSSEFAPLNEYKMLYGQTNTPASFDDIVIGSSLSTSRFWEGGIAEIIGFDTIPSDSIKSLVNEYIQNKYAPPVNLGVNIYNTNYCDTVLYAGKRFTDYTWQDGSTSDSLTVSETGWYSVNVTDIFGFTSTDSVYVEFPIINQVPSSIICQNDSLLWSSQLSNLDYNFLWSNASTDSSISLTQADNYWVRVTDNFGCFKYSDTITIAIDSFPTQTTLGLDKTICEGAAIGLVSNTNPVSYLWSNNDTTVQTIINASGQYWLQTSNVNSCINRDTINITLNGIAPTVGFATQKLCINEAVQFTDTSITTDGSNIVTWSWSFGDVANSNLSNPQHQYNNDSTYLVTLTIQTDSNCENTITQSIQIHQKPIAGFFTTTTPICSGQPTNFSDNSFSADGAITAWNWNFGDTGLADTSSFENPNYNFGVTGIYNVEHIVTSQYNCSDTVSNLITVKASPTASFTTVNHCLNNSTEFTNTSLGNIIASSWSFGDATSSLLSNPIHTYTSAATFNVTLITSELNGCVDTTLIPITIYESPVANFNANDICVFSDVQFYDSSTVAAGTIVDWNWNVENHTNQSSDQHPIFSFADTGMYYIQLLVTSNFGCKDSIIDTIQVDPLPIPAFTFTPDVGAPPLLVSFNNLTSGNNTYLWSFGDNSSSTSVSPTHNYIDSNTYFINMIATSNKGCVDSISQSIRVYDPILDVAVTQLKYSINTTSNFLNITVNIANYGNYDLTNVDLIAEITGTGAVLEKWTGNLLVGDNVSYTFKSSFEINNGEIPDLICVNAKNPNNGIDVVMSNNEYCVSLAKFVLVSLFPNPASNSLNLHYIMPTDGKVVIRLHDAVGKQVIELSRENAKKGINRSVVNLTPFKKGIYFVEISFNENSIKEKVVIKE